MSQKTSAALLLGIIGTLFMVYIVIPYFQGGGQFTDNPQYSQNCKFQVGVMDALNETFAAPTGATLKIFTNNYVLLETITISSGVFTSSLYYESGETVRWRFEKSGWQTCTGTFTFDYYDSPEQPISGYHALDSIYISENPTTGCMYALNDAWNTSAITTYDISTSGTQVTVELVFTNSNDDSRNYNWDDANYHYEPIVVVVNNYYNSSAVPLDVKITGLERIQAETSTQDGIYIATCSEGDLNRDKEQATGLLIENNKITVSFTLDLTQVTGSEIGVLKFYLYEDDDVNYHRDYASALSGATTWQAPSTYNVWIKY
ncbi:MAG: hypothetical protein ACTSQI_07680 [Candidatus Helarchaeota archaeon]